MVSRDFPAASYDAWKLESPEDEQDRFDAMTRQWASRLERDPDEARDERIENERLSLGEIITGTLIVPVGLAIVALASLADEANAAQGTVACSTGFGFGTVLIIALMAWSVGYISGLLVMGPSDPEDDGRIDAPPALRTRSARNDRVRQ